MDFPYFFDLLCLDLRQRNLLGLIYYRTFRYKYTEKIPKNDSVKKIIGYLNIIEDFEESIFNLKFLPKLKYLDCSQFETPVLELNENHNLIYINCSNCNMVILKISDYCNLSYLNYSINPYISIIEYRNIKSLKYLNCSDGFLPKNFLSKDMKLRYFNNTNMLNINSINELLGIIHSKSIIYLDCSCNSYKNLDLRYTPKLRYLFVEYNNLTELNLKQIPFLKHLNCSYNKLKRLELEHTPNLEILYCCRNDLHEFKVTDKLTIIKSDFITKFSTDFRLRF